MPQLWERRRQLLILAVLVVFHLILISVQAPRGEETTYFERAFFFVTSPVQQVAVGAYRGIASVWENYFDLRGVRAENKTLKRELFFSRQEKWFLEERLRLLEAEALFRQSLENFRESMVLARVVGIDPANLFRSVTVDKGLLSGIKKDLAVCDKFGNVVGRTIDPIGFSEATVQLITDRQSGISVISSRSRVVGVLSGTSGELCVLDFVLATSSGAESGEDVFTTGFDGIYPPGLRVGRILSESPAEGTVFKDIIVQPYFSFNTLEAVALLPALKSGEGEEDRP